METPAKRKIYTSRQWPHYILGHRCDRGHGGNRRYSDADGWAECQGCGNFASLDGMGFASRAEAERADRPA